MTAPRRRTNLAVAASLVPALLAVGCGGGGSSTPGDAGVASDAAHDTGPTRRESGANEAGGADASVEAATGDAALDGSPGSADGGGCHGVAAPADRVRKVVVSHPYDASQNASGDFEVFDLDMAGAVTQPKVHFSLGATTGGAIAFTPDGDVGLVAEDDGTLGVFRFDATGAPVVVSASMKLPFYVQSVVMDPSGSVAYALDDETANNGGGIYTLAIACDGAVTSQGLLASAQLPAAVVTLGGGDAVVAAKSFLGVPPLDAGGPDGGVEAGADAGADGGHAGPSVDAVRVPWPGATKVLGTADPFGDDQAIVASAALTSDGAYVLLGDDNQYSSVPNRVGVVRVGATGIVGAGFVPNVTDPQALVASPFDDTVLVVSGLGNAFYALTPSTEGGSVPFALGAPIAYVGAAPQLPGAAVLIARGGLKGRVIVAENQAIRQASFGAQGGVTDLGATPTGGANDFTAIVGALGVQP